MFVVRRVLFAACCLTFVGCWRVGLLSVVSWLFVVRCVLLVVCLSLAVGRWPSLLFVVGC